MIKRLICWIRGCLYRPTYTMRKRQVRGRGTVCEVSFKCERCAKPSGWIPNRKRDEFMKKNNVSWS